MVSTFNEFLEKNKKINTIKQEKNLQKSQTFKNLIEESDINISKPITIESLLTEKNKNNNTKKNSLKNKDKEKTLKENLEKLNKTNIIKEDENDNSEYDSLNGIEVERMINRRITQSIKVPKKISHNFNLNTENHNNQIGSNGNIYTINETENANENNNENNGIDIIKIDDINNNKNEGDNSANRLHTELDVGRFNSNLNQFQNQKIENNFKNIFKEDVIIPNANANNEKLQHRNSKEK